MFMTEEIGEFIQYMHDVKQTSSNTEISYERDLRKLGEYFENQGVNQISAITVTNLNSYILYKEKNGMKSSTVSRAVASCKAFFQYEAKLGKMKENPAENLKSPRIEKKVPGVLTVDETIRLLEQPSGTSPKELRDKAMLELL